MGKTHIVSGMAAYNAATLAATHVPVMASLIDPHPSIHARVFFTIVWGGSATLCDLDACKSTASETFGPATELLARIIRWIARGHRNWTHTAVAAIGFGCYTAAAIMLAGWGARHGAAEWVAALPLIAFMALVFASTLEGLHWAHSGLSDLAAIAAAVALVAYRAHVPDLVHGLPLAVGGGILAHIAGDMLTTHGCPIALPLSRADYHLTPRFLRFATGTWRETLLRWSLAGVMGWFTWTLMGAGSLAVLAAAGLVR